MPRLYVVIQGEAVVEVEDVDDAEEVADVMAEVVGPTALDSWHVEYTDVLPPSPGASGAPKPEPPRNRGKAAGVDGLTALGQEDTP